MGALPADVLDREDHFVIPPVNSMDDRSEDPKVGPFCATLPHPGARPPAGLSPYPGPPIILLPPPFFYMISFFLFSTGQVWDIIVVGAGIAGASFAYQQGRDGRRVLLLERDLT
jgi:hypothetical protein